MDKLLMSSVVALLTSTLAAPPDPVWLPANPHQTIGVKSEPVHQMIQADQKEFRIVFSVTDLDSYVRKDDRSVVQLKAESDRDIVWQGKKKLKGGGLPPGTPTVEFFPESGERRFTWTVKGPFKLAKKGPPTVIRYWLGARDLSEDPNLKDQDVPATPVQVMFPRPPLNIEALGGELLSSGGENHR